MKYSKLFVIPLQYLLRKFHLISVHTTTSSFFLRGRIFCTILRYFNNGSSFKLRWCRARDLLGSQVLVTTGGFELRISCIWSSYVIHEAIRALWPSGLGNYFICKRFAVQSLLWSLEVLYHALRNSNSLCVYLSCRNSLLTVSVKKSDLIFPQVLFEVFKKFSSNWNTNGSYYLAHNW